MHPLSLAVEIMRVGDTSIWVPFWLAVAFWLAVFFGVLWALGVGRD